MRYADPARRAARNRRDRERREAARLARPFVALDGEGVTDDKGKHRYILLCASTGESLADPDGLDFTRVAEFLFGLRDKYPSAIFCGFGLTYDINCWLASEGLQWIADNLLDRPNGKVCYIKTMRRSLYLEWRPRRTFTLGFPGHPGEGLTIYDVWGFFGAGLVQALREHKIGEPEEWEALEAMKSARGQFLGRPLEELRAYCQRECVLTAALMEHLRQAILGLADVDGLNLRLALARWDGPGALAAELLRAYHVREHMLPRTTEEPAGVLAAYYGGRIETQALGAFSEAWQYDLNSAYPWALTQLPCLAHAHYVALRPDEWDGEGWALCRVVWRVPEGVAFGPFPFRDRHGRVSYPTDGTGWYWSPEVRAAAIQWGDPAITLTEVYALRWPDGSDSGTSCGCGGTPFAWVEQLYAERKRLQGRGDARQIPIKMGLNAIYGKLAQGVGKASWQQFAWAGMVTSMVRARILDAVQDNAVDWAVLAIATDGLLSTARLDRLESSGTIGPWLGGWKVERYTTIFLAGNGLYQYHDGDGYPRQRTRGFTRFERVDWAALRAEFKKRGLSASVKVPLNRFIGATVAARLKKGRNLFGRWITSPAELVAETATGPATVRLGTLTLDPGGRIIAQKRGTSYWTEPLGAPEQESTPHRPKIYRGQLRTPEELALLLEGETSELE